MNDKPKKPLSFKPPAKLQGAAPPAQEPRKTLTIKPKATPTTTTPPQSETESKAVARTGKRIIKRDELKPAALAKPKPPKSKPKQKPKARKRVTPPPSELRARELRDSLNAFPVWLHMQPLALGIEREVFQHIGKHHLSASKRVVQKLLHAHTHNRVYLMNVGKGGQRFHLDGSEAGEILREEREYAGRLLAG